MRALLASSTAMALALGSLAAAQSHWITILDRSTPNAHTVRTFDESQPQLGGTVFLADIEILALEKTQRTQICDLDFARSRLVERQGLRFVETPSGAKLLHYRRLGGTKFGYLLVQPSGQPIVLDERDGTGIGMQTDPYGAEIGVAGNGLHAAFATATELVIARLDGQSFLSTGTPSRALTIPNGAGIEFPSLSPGATHVFFVSDDAKIWRCALADGSALEDITPITADVTAEPDDGLAMSGDGTSVVFLFGPRNLESLWFVDGANPAWKLPPPPAKYEDAGYLPDTLDGPRLMLNHDGTQLMYVDATVRDEAFVIDTVTSTTTHYTSDANFVPYIGVTILPTFYGAELMVAVGDPTRLDWFRVTNATGAVTNVSQTGAGVTPPFDTGSLTPLTGARFDDGTLVSFELQLAGPTRLQSMNPSTGTIWSMPRTLRDVPRMGSSLGATPRLRIATNEGDLLFRSSSGSPTLSAPPGIELSTEIVEPGGSFSLLTATLSATGVSALLLNAPNRLVPLAITSGFEQVALTQNMGVVLDTGVVRYVGPAGDHILGAGGAAAVILSGASN